jgi:endo-1,4-beta-xylanase
MNITGHCLIWHQQCPEWFFQDGAAPAGRERVLSRMKNHIQTVMGRYRGRIQGWDVVNEALDDGDRYMKDIPWTRCVGEDYVAKAFEYAAAADPSARLYYNDYNIELPGKLQKAVRLLVDLKDRGLPVDAVGIQAHWLIDRLPLAQTEAAIEQFASMGLKVMITELDIDVVEREIGADVAMRDASAGDPYPSGLPQEVQRRLADQYAQAFALFRRHAKAISRITFWGLHDGRSWLNHWPRRRTNHPLLFDRQGAPKPAFSAVLQHRKPLAP